VCKTSGNFWWKLRGKVDLFSVRINSEGIVLRGFSIFCSFFVDRP